jgi:hypothetical protein
MTLSGRLFEALTCSASSSLFLQAYIGRREVLETIRT